ncbi:MAG: chromosome segregation protein SMC [Selenomonadaceae bacterium]|nr:chromosome segregation protein SMC [Selenomonadaceae bacterium]
MQLKRLTAYGFKSFADKIEVDFDKGVTAIVGPNGSGKSNITDAIRWVLGEQNVRNLRGLKTEDIIFTGSKERRQLGVAEVSLYFSNDDARLPVDYSEVIITRRLFRSGESECYINKVPCRLKDIHLLLADTGIGREGISIIGQNKIDEILNSKPEERRLFFEEAAGITKFRTNRKEASRKLENTQNNLTRVNDILREIDTQLEPLKIEAEKTRQYNELSGERDKAKITGLLERYEREQQEISTGKNKLLAKNDAEVSVTAELAKAEAEKQELSQRVLTLENDLSAIGNELLTLSETIKDKEGDLRLLDEQRRNDEETLERYSAEEKQKEEAVAAGKNAVNEYTEDNKALQEKRQQISDTIGVIRNEISIKNAEIKKVSDKYSQSQAARLTAEQNVSEKKNAIALLEKDIDSETERQARSGEAEKEISAALNVGLERLQAAESSLASLNKQYKEKEDAYRNNEREARVLRDKLFRVQQELKTKRQLISQIEAKLQVLSQLQSAYEGFGRAPRSILSCHEVWRGRIHGAVAELFNVPEKYVTAVEIALGAAQQYIVTEDMNTAKAAIEYLKINKVGRVTFLPLDSLNDRKPLNISDDIKSMKGYIGLGHELIETKPEYDIVSRFLLATTIVVDGFDNANAIARKLGYRNRLVTLSGELLNPGGSVSGGSTRNNENSFLNRRGEIASLTETLKERKSEEKDIAADEASAVTKLESLEQNKEALSGELQQILIQTTAVKSDKANLEELIAEKSKNLEDLRAAVAQFSVSFAQLQEKKAAAHRELREVIAEAEKSYEESRQLGISLTELETEAKTLSDKLHQNEVEQAAVHQQINFIKEKIILKYQEIEQLEQSRQTLKSECLALVEKLSIKSDDRLKAEAQLNELKKKLHELNDHRDALYSSKMDALTEGNDKDEEIRKVNRHLSELRQEIQELELHISKRQFAADEAKRSLEDDFSISIAAAEAKRLELSGNELLRHLRRLEEKIRELGPVNPNAIEDAQRLDERRSLLSTQAGDLRLAMDNLISIINNIDEKMRERLIEAFDSIRRYFGETFISLFGGGEADLIRTGDGDILAAGIDINVTIPNKKRQNLSALSGGERALTVIALLFAVLRYSPSPFAVLDEIDAPLDEANITRFGTFLKEFSENTQFIIVTHRKGTMDSADTLYGVTLEDSGISKIISVKFDE